MALPAVLIEAFAHQAGEGNGACVVQLASPAPAHWMGRMAGSLRQSETAFLLPHGGDWLLRWFTPQREVPLCGHATLASLLALDHWGQLHDGRTHFHTRSGPLPACLDPARSGWGQLLLPGGELRPALIPHALQRLLLERLGPSIGGCFTCQPGYLVVLLEDKAPLATMPAIAAELEGEARDGLVLMQALPTTRRGVDSPHLAGEPADYQLRFFAPGLGIAEDPVTGSAHAAVAVYWQQRLGRSRLVGWQCSDRPGGMVCEVESSGMIRLIGSGLLLWDGTLMATPPPGWPGNWRHGSSPCENAFQAWLACDSRT